MSFSKSEIVLAEAARANSLVQVNTKLTSKPYDTYTNKYIDLGQSKSVARWPGCSVPDSANPARKR